MLRTTITMLALIGLVAAVAAEPAPADAAKYRQSIMKAISGHNGAIRLIVAGKAGDRSKLTSHIDSLSELTTEVDALFQAGSDLDDDEALPAIWEDPDAFAEAIAKLDSAVENLKVAGDSGDIQAIDDAHRQLGKACKGCHEKYRKDD